MTIFSKNLGEAVAPFAPLATPMGGWINYKNH